MAELARIGVGGTQVAAAIVALLACDFGASVSNRVGQVADFDEFAMGWHGR